ncbi:MAG: alpha/beta hydrolase fold domain-containing protein, partial [Bryobacteraceae bacterium]
PGFQFVQDPLEYSSRTHHTNMDVYDRLQKNDLMQASAIMASFVYHAAIREEKLPRKPLPKPQVQGGTRRDVVFHKIGDVALTLDASIPEGDGPFPAAIIVHGGGFTRGDKQTFVPPLFEPLSQADFAWFSINYRLAPQAKYPAAVEDVERAIAWVRSNARRYKVDPDKIALIGESAGGHLVSMAGARNKPDSRVNAVVSFYGPHDFEARAVASKQLSESVQAFLGVSELNDTSLKALREASPINHVSGNMPPYLLIHGTKDEAVPYDQSPRMCEKMRAAGASCEVITVDGAPHGIGAWEKVREHQKYKTRMVDWLKETMK